MACGCSSSNASKPLRPDPLTGWNGSGDTNTQVRDHLQEQGRGDRLLREEGPPISSRAGRPGEAEDPGLRRQFPLGACQPDRRPPDNEAPSQGEACTITVLRSLLGTRPEAIKLAPLAQALLRRGIRPRLFVTGQHPDLRPGRLWHAGASLARAAAVAGLPRPACPMLRLVARRRRRLAPRCAGLSSFRATLRARSAGHSERRRPEFRSRMSRLASGAMTR